MQPSETLLLQTSFFWPKPGKFGIHLMQISPLSSSPEVCNLQQMLSVLDNFLRKITQTENLFADLVWRLWNVLMTKNASSCSAFQKKLAIILKPLPTISLFQWFPPDERLRGTFRWISSLNKKLLWSATRTILLILNNELLSSASLWICHRNGINDSFWCGSHHTGTWNTIC